MNVRGGWRDATEVAFHGIGMDQSTDAHLTYGFEQPYGSASLTVRPTRRLLLVRGGFEAAEWDLKPGTGLAPSVDSVYTPRTLPGLDTDTTYLHTQATVGITRASRPAHARRR